MSEPQNIDVYLQSLNRRIERRQSTAAPEVTADRWAFREAAAVLVTFDLARLRPVPGPGVTADASASSLLPDIVPTPLTGSPGSSMLVAEIRKASLSRLQARNAIRQALEANPDRPRDE